MTKLKDSQGQDFEPASVDIHDAVCCEFQHIGMQDTPFGPKDKGMLVFQVAELDENGKRKEVSLYFTMTWGTEKMPSLIRKVIEKWRGAAMSDADRENFELESLVGKPCRLDVVQKESQKTGRVRAHIDSILRPGETKLTPLDYIPRAERQNAKGTNDKAGATKDPEVPW